MNAILTIGTGGAATTGTTTKPVPAATADASDGGPFVELGTHRDWAVARNDLTCLAYTFPTSVTPRNAANDETVFAIVVERRQSVGYPSFAFSFEPSPDYFVTARIDGGATFDFDPNDNFAYLSRPADERIMVAALQDGVAMEVVSVTRSGQTRTERYSLLGATAALASAIQACR